MGTSTILYLFLALLTRHTTSFSPSSRAFVSPTTSTHKGPRTNIHVLSQLRAQSPYTSSNTAEPTPPEFTSFSNDTTATLITHNDYALSTATALAPPEDRLSLWKRRLITREDPFSIHKISSIVFTVSGTAILATAAVRFAMGPEVFAEIPNQLFLPTYAFTFSNIIMCLISIRMSFLHRRYDLTARNAFLGTAASSLFSGFYFLWTNPLGPDIFNNQLVTQTCFATLMFLNAVLITDTCVRVSGVVEGRRDRKAQDYNGRFFVDALAYVFPVAWGLPFVLATGWVDAVLYNREWFFEQCQYIDQQTGAPGMQANLCYLQVLTSFGPAMGALFVTLRDKKLISKQQEVTGITIFSVPALVWTIWVTATFFSYMTWE